MHLTNIFGGIKELEKLVLSYLSFTDGEYNMLYGLPTIFEYKCGITGYEAAVCGGNLEVAKRFVDGKHINGEDAINIAAQYDRYDLVEYIAINYGSGRAISVAAANGNITLVKLLKNCGVEDKDHAIWNAVWNKHDEIAMFLIGSDAACAKDILLHRCVKITPNLRVYLEKVLSRGV